MKKRLKLKNWVKELLMILLCFTMIIIFAFQYVERINEIESNPKAYETRTIQINFNK